MILTIAGIASLAALLNAILPSITRSSGAVITASSKVDERLKTDIEIIHTLGEMDSSGSFQDTNSNGDFEVFIWVKNVGDTRIVSIEQSDVFLGPPGGFVRIPHLSEVEAGVYPQWSYEVEGNPTAGDWSPRETLKVSVNYGSDVQSQGSYDVKIILPNGIADEGFFSM